MTLLRISELYLTSGVVVVVFVAIYASLADHLIINGMPEADVTINVCNKFPLHSFPHEGSWVGLSLTKCLFNLFIHF